MPTSACTYHARCPSRCSVVVTQAEWDFERACTLLEVNERISSGEDVASVQRFASSVLGQAHSLFRKVCGSPLTASSWVHCLTSQYTEISKKWQKESLKNKISFANDSITIQVLPLPALVNSIRLNF